MLISNEHTDSKSKMLSLEVEAKHLRNELRLTKVEYEKAITDYYEIYSNLEKLVNERTSELETTNSKLEAEIEVRKKTEGALRVAAEKAEAAVLAKSDFLANMSHEIRTPLNGIVGMVNLLGESQLSEENKEYMKMAMISCDSLLALINDILDFSKIEAGKLEFESISFDLEEEIESLLEMFSARAQERQIELNFRYSDELPQLIVSDRVRIRQIINNLLSNAIKFTESGHVFVEVDLLSVSAKDSHLSIRVEDSGIGIHEEKVDHIFQNFTQADSSTTRKYGGTGLGLAICKQLVEMMGGQIKVTSKVGAGSAFSFSLPLAKGEKHPVTGFWHQIEILENKRILLVDDGTISRRFLTDYLTRWKTRPVAVGTPQNAITALFEACEEEDPFEMVILDYFMPDMNGMQLGKAIRKNPKLSQTKLILLSSLGRAGDSEEFFKAGFSAYLTKPIHWRELQQTLIQLFANSSTTNKNQIITRSTVNVQQSSKEKINDAVLSFGLKILVAEDNLVNQFAIKTVLTKFGCDVTIAENGKLAIESLLENEYDIVLMDVQMPEMDGFEATKNIRALDSEKSNIPIIAMTANALEGDKELCLEIGMNDYLSKPAKKEDILQILKIWDPKKEAETKELHQTTRSEVQPKTGENMILNIEDTLSRYEGDVETVTQLLEMFLEDMPEKIQGLFDDLNKQDFDAAARCAHSIRGASAYIGAEQYGQIATQIESVTQNGADPQLESMVKELSNAFDLLKAVVEKIDWEEIADSENLPCPTPGISS